MSTDNNETTDAQLPDGETPVANLPVPPTTPADYEQVAGTVADFETYLDVYGDGFDADDLREIRQYEVDREETRVSITNPIDERLDDLTSGPDMPEDGADEPSSPDTDEEDENANTTPTAMDIDTDDDRLREGLVSTRTGLGEGATGAGQPGVVLPLPGDDEAPATVQVAVPRDMTFAGTDYTTAGVYEVAYDMRVKTALETETNPVALAPTDSLHPQHAESSGPAGEAL